MLTSNNNTWHPGPYFTKTIDMQKPFSELSEEDKQTVTSFRNVKSKIKELENKFHALDNNVGCDEYIKDSDPRDGYVEIKLKAPYTSGCNADLHHVNNLGRLVYNPATGATESFVCVARGRVGYIHETKLCSDDCETFSVVQEGEAINAYGSKIGSRGVEGKFCEGAGTLTISLVGKAFNDAGTPFLPLLNPEKENC